MNDKLELKNPKDRKKIADLLNNGKVGLFPTDTVWGLCCSVKNENAVKRIFEIKQREKDKPFLILGSSIDQLSGYTESELRNEITDKYWPGPLTIVYKANKKKVPSIIRAGKNTVAMRIPNYKEILEILNLLKEPIVAPSANLSGEKTPSSFSEVDRKIVEAVDFIVGGECKIKKPSTIIDCSGSSTRILREGAVDFKI